MDSLRKTWLVKVAMAPFKKSVVRDVMPVLPKVICDERRQVYYTVGDFLGKGGFAACYKVVDADGHIFASKIVNKQLLKNKNEAQKLSQEIRIHKCLQHEHIVKMYFAFEDSNNVYMMLELCSRRSLMELQKRRHAITEPEARYFIRQTVLACDYLHRLNIIHRDIKLGNLFLTENMMLKVGDFGLATSITEGLHDKKWVCGTPNYIAPEVLNKRLHSVKVDIWAVGCVMYVLLVGTPPFETDNLDETYRRICNNKYKIPVELSVDAIDLIKAMLSAVPTERPDTMTILKSPFMTSFTPARLPISCLTTKPTFATSPVATSISPVAFSSAPDIGANPLANRTCSPIIYLKELSSQVDALLAKTDSIVTRELSDDSIKDPASIPIYWVAKWLDFTQRYAFAYQLCDGSFGAKFVDRCQLIMDANREYFQYRDERGVECFFTSKGFPNGIQRKISYLKSFIEFMDTKLVRTGVNMGREGDQLARLPCLQTWVRTRSAASFLLSNGTFQCNFNGDHTKLIICPLMAAVTFIDANSKFHTYKFSALSTLGAPKEIMNRIAYVRRCIGEVMIRQSLAQNLPSYNADNLQKVFTLANTTPVNTATTTD